MVKCIAGCSGDNVEGIKGIGEKTAIKYINGKLKKTHKAYQNIEKSLKIIIRNHDLVHLPFLGTPDLRIHREEEFKMGQFAEVCYKYGMDDLVSSKWLNIWERYFVK